MPIASGKLAAERIQRSTCREFGTNRLLLLLMVVLVVVVAALTNFSVTCPKANRHLVPVEKRVVFSSFSLDDKLANGLQRGCHSLGFGLNLHCKRSDVKLIWTSLLSLLYTFAMTYVFGSLDLNLFFVCYVTARHQGW